MKNNAIPLQTLYAFEAAARLLSFTKAANELHLSQSAISQQIRNLEYALGTQLFVRLTRKLALTGAGETYFVAVGNALETLDYARQTLSSAQNHHSLTIVSTASLNSQWLVNSLQHFRLMHPEIELTIYQGEHPSTMEAYDADIGIFYGSGHWKNRQATKIHQDRLFPVCSHQFQMTNNLESICDITNHTLLGDADKKHNHWKEWFEAAGEFDRLVKTGINFDNMSDMISAVHQGQGIALVRGLLVEDDLATGRLVRLFDIDFVPPFATYFIRGKSSSDEELVDIFYAWITGLLT